MKSLAIDYETTHQEAEGHQTTRQPTNWTLQVDTAHPELVGAVILMTQQDTVTWYFKEVKAGYVPAIHFREVENPAASPNGPFQSLSAALPADNGFDFKIIGSGNNGINGRYFYGVILFQPGAERIRHKVEFVEDPHIDNQGIPPTHPE